MSQHVGMRRRDRALSEDWAWQALERGEYGVPLSYCVLDVHCATEGRKWRCCAHGPYGHCTVVFPTSYASVMVMVDGPISVVSDEAMKARVLTAFVATYLGHACARTAIWALSIAQISGKANMPTPDWAES